VLSAEQVESYERDGFLVLPDFVSTDACQRLRTRVLEIVDAWQPSNERSVFTTNEQERTSNSEFLESGSTTWCFFEEEAFDPDGELAQAKELSINKIGHAQHDLDDEFAGVAYDPRLAEAAADVGMVDPLALQSMYIFKQPRIGGEVTCHTDHTYLWTEPRSVVGFWFAIDDATTENGCLWALPGGHRIPVKGRSRLNEAGTATVMDVFDPEPYPSEGLVALEATRGTLVLLDGALPHLSGPNRSDKPRHAYTVHAIDATARYLPDNWLQRPTMPLRGFRG
jgi:phytanoyl-CoA hydroxylase